MHLRRLTLTLATLALVTILPCIAAAQMPPAPNIIIIFADDMGYGDMGCFGHPTIRTPNLDRMAQEGMRFTQFYSASPVCTPSRAALMTGRLPIRNGMVGDKRHVLFPDSVGGLPPEELTVAEALKDKGYATTCIGKWHLGHLPQYLPTNQGFDSYFGIPYSNDMDDAESAPKDFERFFKPKSEYWNVPLMENEKVVERPAQQETLTKRYTERAVDFIKQNKDNLFFIYMPHAMPHLALFRSEKFENVSRRGLYGDVIQEIDWSVGQIMDTLKAEGLDKDTLIFVTSDNGPWYEMGGVSFREHGGSAGLLKEGKGSTWEGGMREPTLAWWPGRIAANSVSMDIACTMDIFATCLGVAGVPRIRDRKIDGVNLMGHLLSDAPSPRKVMPYYKGTRLMALRKGPWKAHFRTWQIFNGKPAINHDPPLLYNLDLDPSEKYNVAAEHEDIVSELKQLALEMRTSFSPPISQLDLATADGSEPGFDSVFDGNSLDGWAIENGGQFSAKDGLLHLNKGTGWLRSEDTFEDFVLKFDFRFLEEKANSGIFIRTGPTSKDDDNGWPDNGYQVQCMDTLEGIPLATMIPYGAPPFEHETDMEALKDAYRPTGEWNQYEIECIGETLKVKLNGVPVTTATSIKNRSGHIGIQGEHGKLEFRGLRVKRVGA